MQNEIIQNQKVFHNASVLFLITFYSAVTAVPVSRGRGKKAVESIDAVLGKCFFVVFLGSTYHNKSNCLLNMPRAGITTDSSLAVMT